MNILKGQKGFTLIELLVVIAIIGILAALIIVSLTGARGRAQDTQRKNNARTLNSALEQYAVDNGSNYPGDGQSGPSQGVALATACASGGILNLDNGSGAGGDLFGTGLYIQNTNVCSDPTSLSRFYNANAQNNPALSYHIVWQLASQSEAVVTSGNGVYSSDATGAITVGGITTNTGVNSTRFFGVYGPQ